MWIYGWLSNQTIALTVTFQVTRVIWNNLRAAPANDAVAVVAMVATLAFCGPRLYAGKHAFQKILSWIAMVGLSFSAVGGFTMGWWAFNYFSSSSRSLLGRHFPVGFWGALLNASQFDWTMGAIALGVGTFAGLKNIVARVVGGLTAFVGFLVVTGILRTLF